MLRLVFVMALLAGLLLAIMPVQAGVWDLSADFNGVTNGAGAWSYGYDIRPNGGGGIIATGLYTSHFPTADARCISWSTGSYAGGEIVKNVSGAAFTDAPNLDPWYFAPTMEKDMVVFLGVEGEGGAWRVWERYAAWTAPTDMAQVTIQSQFTGQYNYNNAKMMESDVNVLLNDASLFTGAVNGFNGSSALGYADAWGVGPTKQTFSTTLYNIKAGDVVKFMTGPGGAQNGVSDPYYEMLGVSATITSQDVPEPGSMLALGSGLVGMLGFAIRRRRA